MIIQEPFTAKRAAAATKTTERMLGHWNRTDFLIPSLARAKNQGYEQGYSWNDLLIIAAVKRLRDNGISLQALRKVSAQLKASDDASFRDVFLTCDGKRDIVLRSGEELISMLQKPGQIVFAWILSMEEVETEVREAVIKMGKAAKAA